MNAPDHGWTEGARLLDRYKTRLWGGVARVYRVYRVCIGALHSGDRLT